MLFFFLHVVLRIWYLIFKYHINNVYLLHIYFFKQFSIWITFYNSLIKWQLKLDYKLNYQVDTVIFRFIIYIYTLYSKVVEFVFYLFHILLYPRLSSKENIWIQRFFFYILLAHKFKIVIVLLYVL